MTSNSHNLLLPGLIVCVGLGGNLPDSMTLCLRAVAWLQHHPGVQLVTQSPFYRTQPVGPVHDQPWYCNGVVTLKTQLAPHLLWRLLVFIERSLGRNRSLEIHWGPRCLDLDLLYYGNYQLRTSDLILPHPRLHQRRFVLQPMADVSPAWIHPLFGKTVDTMLQEVEDNSQLYPWTDQKSEILPCQCA